MHTRLNWDIGVHGDFDENQAVSDINKYEFLNTKYVKIVNFLVI